ncbi:glycosyltransferase [Geodermatophilus sp. SYSU D00684]
MSYGSFASRPDGAPFPVPEVIAGDIAAMASSGVNTVRTYSVPPPEVLDCAAEHGMHVLVGLHYEDWRYERVASRASTRRVADRAHGAIDAALDAVGDRPEVLALSIGNEIPVDVLRVHGISRVEGVLESLVCRIHDARQDLLVTYGNFPTTEFLTIDNLDVVTFNVFLEEPAALRRYLRHLQSVAGDKPLLVGELGLASEIHGVDAQARSLEWQLRTVDEVGCAGATVFSWTDEWVVDGSPVTGWGFGVTDERRRPKPANDVVSAWARRSVAELRDEWPTISVVVCAYNEEATLAECLESLEACSYPDLDVVVCDDGSTDATAEIARRHPFRLLELEHGGLSRARNAGLAAARGDVVAYLDADAACHPEWPFHLALSLEDERIVATGGPNLPVDDAGLVERAVALSPGSPMEVLTSHDRAEHVPGCNMAFRREALQAIGGFDPVYTAAGDDVDVCWKLLDRGWEIGFAPAAQVNHHRRGTVKGYLKQQRGYGRAERLLWSRHRHRFNRLGQARWSGTIYGATGVFPRLLRPVVYHGYAGTAPFQPRTRRRDQAVAVWGAALLPLVTAVSLVALLLGILHPLGLVVAATGTVAVLGYGAAVATAARLPRHEPRPLALRVLVAWLHVLQPLVRAWGRLRGERRPADPYEIPDWYGDREWWLTTLSRAGASEGCSVVSAGETAEHDLELRRGPFFTARITTAVVWRWEPRHRVAVRLRTGPAVAAGIALTVVAVHLPAAAAAFATAAVAGGLAVDARTLHTAVTRALRSTTARSAAGGAQRSAQDEPEPAGRPVEGAATPVGPLPEEPVDEER